MKENLIIFDGTALAYRSHFAFINNPLINSKGQHTSALVGVINSFIKVYETFQPKYIAISFDGKEKTFRHERYPLYKANRPKTPDELISQLDAIYQFFNLIGIKNVASSGYEADDAIGTIAKQFSSVFNVIIVSKDKDFAQLVDENICLYDDRENKFFHETDIIDKYDIKPKQFIDYLALVGDSSDNIPGAKGIGPKTAVKWLHQFNDVETIYANIASQPNSKDKEKLVASREDVLLSKELATIRTDVPLNITQEGFAFHPSNFAAASLLLQEYELTYIFNRLKKLVGDGHDRPAPVSATQPSLFTVDHNLQPQQQQPTFTCVRSIDQLRSILAACTSTVVALDTETTSLDTFTAELVGISLCFDSSMAYYIPLGHTFAENLEVKEVLAIIKTHLQNKVIIGHNLKYDMQILDRYGFVIEQLTAFLFDTMLAAYILDPGYNEYSLDDCAKRELNYTMTPITDLIGKGKKQVSFATVELESATDYAAEDAWATFSLYDIYLKRLKDNNLYELYTHIELPLVFTLSYLEKQGVHINTTELAKLDHEISQQLKVVIEQIYTIAGETFNLNSPQKLADILFNRLHLQPTQKTKTGYSTNIEVLEELAEKHEIARLIIEYRQLSKLQNTYIQSLPQLVNPTTGRVHSSFNQTITSTGRLSSSNPNLQNIPVRTEIGKKIRAAFQAREGAFIVSADYSQIELRIFAALSGDTAMLTAIKNGEDIHTNTAAIVFNKPKDQIDSGERRKAKVINFGIIYGMGAFSLSKELGITMQEGKQFISDYFAHFPTIKAYIENQKTLARKNDWVETIYHRKLFLPGIHSTNHMQVAEAERIAINMPIQGTAADIIKIAMNNVYAKIKDRADIKMIIQVHDELVFEVAEEALQEACTLIKHEMEGVLTGEYKEKINLKVDVGYGKNWAEAH